MGCRSDGPARHLLKPMSSQMKQVFGRSALEAVLAAAAERPPSKEASLGGLRRSFVTQPVKNATFERRARRARGEILEHFFSAASAGSALNVKITHVAYI